MSHQNIWLWRPRGSHPWDLQGSGDPINCSYRDSHRLAHRHALQKAPRLYANKTNFLIFKHWFGDFETVTRVGGWRAPSSCSPSDLLKPIGAIFLIPFPSVPSLCSSWWTLACILSLYLANAGGHQFFLFFSFSSLFSVVAILYSPLPCSRVPVFPRGEFLNMFGAPIIIYGNSVFAATFRRRPLIAWLWRQEELVFLSLMRW